MPTIIETHTGMSELEIYSLHNESFKFGITTPEGEIRMVQFQIVVEELEGNDFELEEGHTLVTFSILPEFEEMKEYIKYIAGINDVEFNNVMMLDVSMNFGLGMDINAESFLKENTKLELVYVDNSIDLPEDLDVMTDIIILHMGSIEAIAMMSGFILDRTWNGIGNTGWDMMEKYLFMSDPFSDKIKEIQKRREN